MRNKTILILSPQSWGKMFLSKHHYAVELAKRGNQVFYLNPPDQIPTGRKDSFTFVSGGIENLLIIHHRLFFDYRLKFRYEPLFHWLMRFQVSRIVQRIDRPIDIIWSFDIGNLYPFHLFEKKSFKIFHPVDEPLMNTALDAARGADVIFSVTREILQKYAGYAAPKHFINHGVSQEFLEKGESLASNEILRVGFSGNLLRPDIDRATLLQIISENKNVLFECWGSFQEKDSNIGGGENEETTLFVNALKTSVNVKLHGPVSSEVLAKEFSRMDAFLICYDINKDQSKGTNYHKVMEYLSTGKVIISNNITTYHHQPSLIQMTAEREHNRGLPELFRSVMNDLPLHNSAELQKVRIEVAADNTYQKQIDRIEKIIQDVR